MGVLGENFRLRQQLIAEYQRTGNRPFEYTRPVPTQPGHAYPKEAPIELTAFPLYEASAGGGSCIGGGGSGAARISPHFQVVTEVSGCLFMHMPAVNQSGDMLFYGGGLRWTPRASHRLSPYLQAMFGGKKVTHETVDLDLRKELIAEWNDGSGTIPHYPKRSDWSVEITNNGPALSVGAGLDIVLARPFAWRVVNFEYSHAWMGDVDMIRPQNAVRFSTAAVLRIGTW